MKGRAMRGALYGAGVALILAWSGFPLYWALVTSLERGSALFDVSFLPTRPTLANYASVFTERAFGRELLNSVLTASLAVGVSLALGVFAAFPLARRSFRGRGALLTAFLLTSMFPQIAILSGLFEVIRALGLYNTVPGLALSYLALTLPFTVWSLTAFLRQVPRELEEAAVLDGARPLTLVLRVFAPMMAPAFVTTGLLAFVVAWNEFLFALTFTLSERARTVPVAIALMSGASEHELPWGDIMAATVVVTLPVVALAWVFQRRIVSGLTAGAVR